jgi:Na+-transporting NADH:ubiquinone oxidoreductase subunit C
VRQSNTYIIGFTIALTVIVGGSLAFTSQILAPRQKISVELDTKSQILSSVMNLDSLKKNKVDIIGLYQKSIRSMVIDFNGNEVTQDEKGNALEAENVDVAKNFKKKVEERHYPVFMYMSPSNPNQVEAYIMPIYGNGLWDRIWGFVALRSDLNTIYGVSFGHKAETPGLGARITTSEIQSRYIGKRVFDERGNLKGVNMVKGEKGLPLDPHHVDGMSGATITGKGVNDMLINYLGHYGSFFQKVKSESAISTL